MRIEPALGSTRRAGRSEAAIECFRESLLVGLDYVDAMFTLALLLQRRNECTEATDYWRRYLAIDSRSEWRYPRTPIVESLRMQQHLIV
jgi:tetratricopeptide (TPR) repeat protein